MKKKINEKNYILLLTLLKYLIKNFFFFNITAYLQNDLIKPSLQAVYEGSKAVIACGSDTPVTFTKDGKTMSSKYQVGNILIMYKTKLKDSGIYHCHGNKSNKMFDVISKLLVASKRLVLLIIRDSDNTDSSVFYSERGTSIRTETSKCGKVGVN